MSFRHSRNCGTTGLTGLAAAAILALSVPVFAQDEMTLEPSHTFSVAPEFRGRVEVHLGTIDVTVLGKDGRVVTGLTREDFVLLVDGQPQEFSNFSAFGAPPSAIPETTSATTETTQSPTHPQPEPRPQLMVVFIDNENISRSNRNLIIARLENMVRERLHPPVRAMVVTNDMGLRRVGDVTSNPDEVVAGLQSLLGKTTGGTKVSNHTRVAELRIRELSKSPTQINIDQAMAAARMNSAQTDEAVWRSVDTLKTLIRTIGGLPGRKDVVYVSDGIPMVPGKETLLLVDELFRIFLGVQTLNELDRTGLFLQVVAYARAADVTIHTVDASGLKSTHASNAESRWAGSTGIENIRQENYQAPLFFMAGQTGGVVVVNTNELEKGLERIGDATSTYYSLGFPLQTPLADRTHKIEISLVDNPEYELHYRRAFRERTVATQTAERTMTGLLLPVQHNPLAIEAEAGMARAAGDKMWIIPVEIKYPLATLALYPDGEGSIGKISTFAVAGSDSGATSTLQHSGQTIRIVEGPGSKPTTATVHIEVESKTGAEKVSIGVLDETSGTTGFTTAEVSLPG